MVLNSSLVLPVSESLRVAYRKADLVLNKLSRTSAFKQAIQVILMYTKV